MKHFVVALSAAFLASCGAYETTEEETAPPTLMKSESDFAKLYGKKLLNGRGRSANKNQYIIISNNGKISGSWDGNPVTGSFEVRGGKFCRDVTINAKPRAFECQTWMRDAEDNLIYGYRPSGSKGKDFYYTFE